MQADTVEATEDQAAIATGMILRRAREARGESLGDVAQALKLSLKQLDALERGHHESLPGPAFVRGFLRNYARHLGLDPAEVLAQLGGERTATVDLTPLSNAAGEMPAGRGVRFNLVPAGVVAGLLLMLMFAGSYFGWFQTVPPPEPVSLEAFPPGQAPEVADDSGTDGSGAEEAVLATGAEGQEAAAALPMGAELALPSGAPAAASALAPAGVESAPGSAPVAAAAASAPSEPLADSADALRFAFTGESWVEVKDGTGRILFAGIGNAGSTRTVQGKGPFALVIGNARNVRLDFRGQPVDLVPHTKVTVARLTVQ